MNTVYLVSRLGYATLTFTVLISLMLLTRRRLRVRLGAEAMYCLWLLVPLGVALNCWPLHHVAQRMSVMPVLPAPPAGALASATAPAAASHLPALVLCAWLLGAGAAVLLLVRRQRSFARALGPLQDAGDGVWLSARADAGPLLIGLVRPRIVLPADFALRYTAPEQAAVLAHERMHRRRGDLWWNAVCAALRCAFWFHLLAAIAQRRFLADQELACGSAVLRRTDHPARIYAEALLKTQTTPGLPLGCAVRAASPLEERILNLRRRSTPRYAAAAIATLLAAATLGGGQLAWAATEQAVPVDDAENGTAYKLALDLSVDNGAPRHEDVVLHGPLHLDGLRDGDGKACEADLLAHALADGRVDIRLQLTCAGQPAANPRLITQLGVPATVAIGRTERQADGRYVTTRGFRLTVKVERA